MFVFSNLFKDISIIELKKEELEDFKNKFDNNKIDEHCNGVENCKIRIWVIKKQDEIIGGIVVNENPKKYNFNIPKLAAKILFFYINPLYRKIGLGKYLFEIIVNQYDKILLVTNDQSSEASKRIYTMFNFKVVGKSGNSLYWLYDKNKK